MSFTVSVDGMRDISNRHAPHETDTPHHSKIHSSAWKVMLIGFALTGLGFLLMIGGGA